MKLRSLMSIAGTVVAIVLLFTIEPIIKASGGDPVHVIPQMLGAIVFMLLIAVGLKRLFFRQR